MSLKAFTIPTFIAAMALSACSPALNKGPESLADKDISVRTPDSRLMRQDAVNFFREQPVLHLQTDVSNTFHLKTEIGGEVPPVTLQRVNAAPMQFAELLAQVAEQVSMSWSITGENREELLSREVYYVQRNETMLETVLEELSKSTNSFYRIDGDKIVFSQTRDFTTKIPRMAGSADIIQSGMSNLGASDVFFDSLSGTLSFSADRRAYHGILDFMQSFQDGRDMIVYDFWVIERALDDAAGAGGSISFEGSNFGGNAGSETLLNSVASGNADSVVISGNLGALSVEATMRFVRALGQAETVSRPTISMLSGESSSFNSGESYEYIREVSRADETTDESGETSGGGTTTDVQSLDTGIDIEVEGTHTRGVVSTQFEISLTNLIEFQQFDTGDVSLRLPRVSERNVSAHLEARPGDVMIIGGIITDRQEKEQANLGATDIPTSRSTASNKTETIILVRPRLVQIRPTGRAVTLPAKGQNVLGDVLREEQRAAQIIKGQK
jgi:type II secretory pathway component GspD/PulD (secretin)